MGKERAIANERLFYVGPSPDEAGGVPLPEGWPAEDHEEPDNVARSEKLASGFYDVKLATGPASEAKE